MRVRVGSYRYSPGWILFVAGAAVANVVGSLVDRVRPRYWRCEDCGCVNALHEWCCYRCGAGR